MILQRLCFLFLLILMTTLVAGQDVIPLKNASFEGNTGMGKAPDGWVNLGFPGQSPPDLHSIKTRFFEVNHKPSDGGVYLGMVARDDGTIESIYQELVSPLVANELYKVEIDLCKAELYLSNGDGDLIKSRNFKSPIRLRIWGFQMNNRRRENIKLLSQSPVITDTNWQSYAFLLAPKLDLSHILLEVFYENPILLPNNGNLLLDNCSYILKVKKSKHKELLLKANPVNMSYLSSKPADASNLINDDIQKIGYQFSDLNINKTIRTTKKLVDRFTIDDRIKYPKLSMIDNISSVFEHQRYSSNFLSFYKGKSIEELKLLEKEMQEIGLSEVAKIISDTILANGENGAGPKVTPELYALCKEINYLLISGKYKYDLSVSINQFIFENVDLFEQENNLYKEWFLLPSHF